MDAIDYIVVIETNEEKIEKLKKQKELIDLFMDHQLGCESIMTHAHEEALEHSHAKSVRLETEIDRLVAVNADLYTELEEI